MSDPIRLTAYYKKRERLMPNIVRVVRAGIESNAPSVKWFEVCWVTEDDEEGRAHVCAKDEFEAWHKINKHLKGEASE